MSSTKSQVGMIGLGVMGRNLVLNLSDQGFSVAAWNLEAAWTEKFLEGPARGRPIRGAATLAELCAMLEVPRKIMIMIKAGPPVDATLQTLLPLLDPGDSVIDGGNSHFRNTTQRQQECAKFGVHFFGTGVSGGEEGARHGPSIMPGGDREAYLSHLHPILEKIAAVSEDGPCVSHMGPGGAGHFVKMVHNGIEYGDMQLIAEAYHLMTHGLEMSAGEISRVFHEWNRGPLSSFLIEITAEILSVRDPRAGLPTVELILDQAGQKGTGKWTGQSALDLGVAVPTVMAATESRFLSAIRAQRLAASEQIRGPANPPGTVRDREAFLKLLEDALYASKLCTYAQGMALIGAASDEFEWEVDLSEVSRVWKAGCIIRARLLSDVRRAFLEQPHLENLLLDREVSEAVSRRQESWRDVVVRAVGWGVPVLAMSTALGYFDSFRTARLPLNLTQAQRDYFGAHTYRLLDDPEGDAVHTDWASLAQAPEDADP